MRATLSFNLPKEKEEFELAAKAQSLASVVSEFEAGLVQLLNNKDLKENEVDLLIKVVDILKSEKIKYGV